MSTAAAKPRLIANSAAWRMRSLMLADRDGLLHTARRTSHTAYAVLSGIESFCVPSRSQAAIARVVTVDCDAGWTLTCDCPAGQHGAPCGHVGAVVHLCGQFAADYGRLFPVYANPCAAQYGVWLANLAPSYATVATWQRAAGW